MRTPLLVLVALALLVGGCRTVSVSEANLIHPRQLDRLPPGAAAAAVAEALPGYTLEEHTVTADDGVRLYAALLRRPGATLTVLYFGGNEFRAGEAGLAVAEVLAPLGVNVMLVDHRGYGWSEGTPTLARMKADAVEAFDYLAVLPGVDVAGIVVHGQSLGSFLAGHVAARRQVGGLVLESTVTTARDWVRSRIPPHYRPLVRVRIDPSLRDEGSTPVVAHLDEPLLILVGSDDAQTPPALSRRLYGQAALPEPMKRLVVLEGAGHNDVPLHPGFRDAYAAFLALVEQHRR
jgi:fermentation-respiration switch protein FrsA (DUF1100 family)